MMDAKELLDTGDKALNEKFAVFATDAVEWAKTLAEKINNEGEKALGDLPFWCANMIEAGREAGRSEAMAEIPTLPTVVEMNASLTGYGDQAFGVFKIDPGVITDLINHVLDRGEADGYDKALAEVPNMAGPTEGMSLIDYVGSIQAGVYRISPVAVGRLLDTAHDEGVKLGRNAGLNDKGEYPAIVLDQSNAVTIYVNGGDNRVFVEVDGRDRLTAIGPTLVTLVDNGNRTVLRSPNMAGPAEPAPEAEKTPVFSDVPSGPNAEKPN